MIFTELGSIRNRATSILTARPFVYSNRNRSPSSSPPPVPTHGAEDETTVPSGTEPEVGSSGRNASRSPSADGIVFLAPASFPLHIHSAQKPIRLAPTWVHSLDEDEDEIDPGSHLLPKAPDGAQLRFEKPCHVCRANPSTRPRRSHSQPRWRASAELGYDRVDPAASARYIGGHRARWQDFAHRTAMSQIPDGGSRRVDCEWLERCGPDYSEPWRAATDGDLEKQEPRRIAWWKRAKRTLLRNPIIPLVFRTIVWIFSLVALILGASIYRAHIGETLTTQHHTSPEMAIIVDAVALVYTILITIDEYRGKPLGLRSVGAKMRLIFLDLFFIVFNSANLSLAFESVSDISITCDTENVLCRQQRALAGVLLIILTANMTTFSISVLRVIERAVPRARP